MIPWSSYGTLSRVVAAISEPACWIFARPHLPEGTYVLEELVTPEIEA